jgi:histidinol dehydrogenase
MLTIRVLDRLDREELRSLFHRAETDIHGLADVVRPVLDDVRMRGVRAVLKYAREFDGADMTKAQLAVSRREFEEAEGKVGRKVRDAIARAVRNVRLYHERQMPDALVMTEVEPGVYAGEKITPIASCGLYVPRGKGSFPSVMVMLGVPAVVAGVEDLCVVSPPDRNGMADPATLVAARACGISRVYKVGGVQAVAALAYGASPVPRMDKIIGPGNPYVSAAKRLLFGVVDVGVPAGPSESIILADETTDPRIAALDLLIEAEHGPDSCALLVTDCEPVAREVVRRAEALVKKLPEPRRSFCISGFKKYGGVVLTSGRAQSIEFTNRFAPEHLEILVAEPFAALGQIKHAGEILIGPHTPITTGNFCLGIDAILPTGGFARTFSGVSVYDFLKRASVGFVTEQGLESIGPPAATLAEYEGFPAHARAVLDRKLK